MYKLNFIAIVGIVAAVSLAVVMASPIAFAQILSNPSGLEDNMTINMGNMSSMGNMTGGGNATSMAETESIPTAGETGYECGGCPCDHGCTMSCRGGC